MSYELSNIKVAKISYMKPMNSLMLTNCAYGRRELKIVQNDLISLGLRIVVDNAKKAIMSSLTSTYHRLTQNACQGSKRAHYSQDNSHWVRMIYHHMLTPQHP